MSSSEQRKSEATEIAAYGRTYDFGDFSVVVRCFAIQGEAGRVEVHLQACGVTAVVDVPGGERPALRDRIAQAARAFAESIRLSGGC